MNYLMCISCNVIVSIKKLTLNNILKNPTKSIHNCTKKVNSILGSIYYIGHHHKHFVCTACHLSKNLFGKNIVVYIGTSKKHLELARILYE